MDHLDENKRNEMNRLGEIVTTYIGGLMGEVKDKATAIFRQRTVLRRFFMQTCNQTIENEKDNRWTGILKCQQDVSEAH